MGDVREGKSYLGDGSVTIEHNLHDQDLKQYAIMLYMDCLTHEMSIIPQSEGVLNL